jgi:hypothetical protein
MLLRSGFLMLREESKIVGSTNLGSFGADTMFRKTYTVSSTSLVLYPERQKLKNVLTSE